MSSCCRRLNSEFVGVTESPQHSLFLTEKRVGQLIRVLRHLY